MTIKNRVSSILGGSLLVIFSAIFYINYSLQTELVTSLKHENAKALNYSLTGLIEEVMISGENEKLQQLAVEMVSKNIAKELTIVDADRIIARSSKPELVGSKDYDQIWGVLFASGLDSVFETVEDDEAVEYSYHLLRNKSACQGCHDAPAEAILGGFKKSKSTQRVKDAIASTANTNLFVFGLAIMILIGGIVFIMRRTIFDPLKDVTAKLLSAASGDIDQDIIVKSNDEIGIFLTSIKELICYIQGFASASQKIAAGDLTVEIKPISESDTLGIAFSKMVERLNEIIGELSISAGELVSAAGEITATSESMATGSRSQAEQVAQVSSAIEEMAATIIESSKNANNIQEVSMETTEVANTGGEIVERTIEGMNKIAQIVSESAKEIGDLSESAHQIDKISKVISDIADQTNLLALNAAIEAARAGEQGRGFAVVADEVRKLAEKTAKATGEITDMIKKIQSQTKLAVHSMEEGVAQVNQGTELTDAAGNSLREIVSKVTDVADLIRHISTAASEQSQAAELISRNVENISTVTSETASGAEQSASAAEQLSRQADGLQAIVSQFKRKEEASSS